MTYDPKKNEGVLFKNDRKERDTQPDYTGSWHDAAGEEYWLSAWLNESNSGKKYMSVKLGDKKEQQAAQPSAQVTELPTSRNFSDDIPF